MYGRLGCRLVSIFLASLTLEVRFESVGALDYHSAWSCFSYGRNLESSALKFRLYFDAFQYQMVVYTQVARAEMMFIVRHCSTFTAVSMRIASRGPALVVWC